MTLISIYDRISSKVKLNDVNVENLLSYIKDSPDKDNILLARDYVQKFGKKNNIQYDSIKARLRTCTWAGTFTQRDTKYLSELSGLMYFDIDDVNAEDVKNELKDFPFIYSCWISVSGIGCGFLVKTNNLNPTNYRTTWELIADTLSCFSLDKLPDVARCNVLSYDNDIYINDNSLVIEAINPTPLDSSLQAITDTQTLDKDYYDECCFVAKKVAYKMYGDFLYDNGTCALNRYFSMTHDFGVDKDDAIDWLERYLRDSNNIITKQADYSYSRYKEKFGTKVLNYR